MRRIVLGTRTSALARRQTQQVAALLVSRWPELVIETQGFATSGDLDATSPCDELPDDAFTDRLANALRAGEIDVAVHSYKDLPRAPMSGLVIAAVPLRADPRDALVARDRHTISTLPSGAVVGTSSARRVAALRASRPDLDLRPIRGPVDARVRQVQDGRFDAAIFAVAGLERLGLAEAITEYLDPDAFPPAAGQGALAVQCRSDDHAVLELLSAIDDPTVHADVRAERDREPHGVVA